MSNKANAVLMISLTFLTFGLVAFKCQTNEAMMIGEIQNGGSTANRSDDDEDIAKRRREFDFWLGDWDVNNRHLNADGSWRQGGKAKAKIRSTLNGKVVLEQWTGQDALNLRGFSIRTFDADQNRWEIVLNWHSGQPSGFSYMVGNFVDGRGEFFPPVGPHRIRFTFSKAEANSCQWDQAKSPDGTDWKTDWIMSFNRTAPKQSLNAENLPIEYPVKSVIGKYEETRALDHLIGHWEGVAKRLRDDGSWEEGTAIRRVTSMIDGFGLLQLTKFSWEEESVAAISYDMRRAKWVEVGMSENEPDCHWLAGSIDGDSLKLSELATSNNLVNHRWRTLKKDTFTWERLTPKKENPSEFHVTLTVDFKRKK